MVQYKWVALSNTTLGVLMASINMTIILISLPAIFRGINIDPFQAGSFEYLLWILMGYNIITAAALVTVGRLSDIFGRVRLFNFGFLVFTVGSILLYLTPNTGDQGALELIIFRMIQALGASFLFANSAAIITDSFPANERGKAMGINQIAALAGSLIGLILGGILSAIYWRDIFLVSVPVGIVGTLWSYIKLKDNSVRHHEQKIDTAGNLTFGSGLALILISVTYGLMPYENSSMGWSNPWVLAALFAGILLLILFVAVEFHVEHPMFDMRLFKNRAFSSGSFAGLLQGMGFGGVQLMLIILLQGIWLPLHGYSYSSVPFWAGIYMIPMMVGFVTFGPLSGALSDRIGARFLSTFGMVLAAASLLLLSTLTYDFSYIYFAAILFVFGCSLGIFAAPNITAVMNSVPASVRGTASGMRATLQNTGSTMSLAIFFTVVLVGLSNLIPVYFTSALSGSGAQILIPVFNKLSPTSALFSAFLGYNPMGQIFLQFPSSFTSLMSQSTYNTLLGTHWFPLALAPAFMGSLKLSFYVGSGLFLLAAILSAMRGKKFIHAEAIALTDDSHGASTNQGIKVAAKVALKPSGGNVKIGQGAENITKESNVDPEDEHADSGGDDNDS